MISSSRATASSVETAPVLERELETQCISDALDRARDGAGTAIVIEGEPGIGKSTLVRQAVREARQRGLSVLRAQGGELEQSRPYGVVSELFAAVAADDRRADLFSGPAAVIEPLLGIGHLPDAPGSNDHLRDPFANVHGLFWLVINLAERGPLLIVVDDAQWADEPTLRFLHRLVQRIDELPVVLLVAMRPDGEGAESATGKLLRAERTMTTLTLEPLTEAGTGDLLSRVAGRPIEEDLRRVSWQATRGNPFFVTELGSEMGRRLPAADPTGEPPVVPDRVGRFIEARLAAGDDSAHRLAAAVAVLGEGATLRAASRLAGLDRDAGVEAARWLTDAGILDDGPAIAFRHPIVRSAVYGALHGPERSALHRRAGMLLADEGADLGVIGAHLRETEPSGDAGVAALLEKAAMDALARAEPQAARTLLQRAIAEPPKASDHARLLAMLARAEAAAGLPVAAETYAQAMAMVDEPVRRAELLLELGHALVRSGQWVAAREAFERGLAQASELDPTLQARLEAGYLSAAWITMEDRARIGPRVDRILASVELGAANRELAVWVAFQQGALVTSTAREMADLVKRALTEAPIERLTHEGQLIEVGAGLLVETDELDFEYDMLTRALEAARRSGPIGKVGVYAYCRSWPNYYAGRLTDAIADTEEALRAGALGWETFIPAAATVAALAHIERDELPEAERVIALDPMQWGGRIDTAMLVPLAAGRVALARGKTTEALEHFRQAAEGAGAAFMRNIAPVEWRAWFATALFAAGRRDEARAIVDEGIEIARAWGADWGLGTILRVSGLVEGGGMGISLLRESEVLLSNGPARLEHARVLVELGAALRRHGSLVEARTVLARGADLALPLGARAILARAVSEQRAAGARPRRIALTGVDALTPAERRVAQEAMAGRSNREIAQALFVTPKAVEFHLANVYRKLDIGSRGELTGVMSG